MERTAVIATASHFLIAGLFMVLRTQVMGRVGQEDMSWHLFKEDVMLAPVCEQSGGFS